MTLVALVSEPGAARARAECRLRARAGSSVAHDRRGLARRCSRRRITAEVALHRAGPGGACTATPSRSRPSARRATGSPGNAERLALAGPAGLRLVGRRPARLRRPLRPHGCRRRSRRRQLGEMDLRDLEKLSSIVARVAGAIRPGRPHLDPLPDDPGPDRALLRRRGGAGVAPALERIVIECSAARTRRTRPARRRGSSSAGSRRCSGSRRIGDWNRGDGWAEARLGQLVARFEQKPRSDVRPGVITRVVMEAGEARFAIERQDDPRVYRWSRDMPGRRNRTADPTRRSLRGVVAARALHRASEARSDVRDQLEDRQSHHAAGGAAPLGATAVDRVGAGSRDDVGAPAVLRETYDLGTSRAVAGRG